MKQPDLGLKIAELRKAKGFTQEELVEKCNLNVRTLQRIESGEVMPRSYTVKIIFKALDYSIHYLSQIKSAKQNEQLAVSYDEPGQFYKYFIDLFNLKTNTMKKISILTLSISLIFLSIFFINNQSLAQSTEKLEMAINEANNKYLDWYNAGKIDSILTLYHDDACLITNKNNYGKEMIRQELSKTLGLNYKFVNLKSNSLNFSKKMAVDRGEFLIRFENGLEVKGTYLTEWAYVKRKWLIVNDISSIQ